MSIIQAVPEDQAQDSVAQTYSRIKDLLEVESLPEVFLLMGQVESFLKDFYMNFKKFVYNEGKLDSKTKSAIALSVALHAKSAKWVAYCQSRCESLGFSQQELAEIVAIASTNYMYNAFFKFRDISGTDRFDGMPVGLRAHAFTGTSLSDQLVELINLVISDLNACQPCTSGHLKKAEQLNLSHEQMLEAIQCASTMYAGCMYVNAAS